MTLLRLLRRIKVLNHPDPPLLFSPSTPLILPLHTSPLLFSPSSPPRFSPTNSPPSPPPPSRIYQKSTANCKVHKGMLRCIKNRRAPNCHYNLQRVVVPDLITYQNKYCRLQWAGKAREALKTVFGLNIRPVQYLIHAFSLQAMPPKDTEKKENLLKSRYSQLKTIRQMRPEHGASGQESPPMKKKGLIIKQRWRVAILSSAMLGQFQSLQRVCRL